jgi:hypothetical protein
MSILFGMLILAAGVLIVIKSNAILSAFGRLEFFEHYLGTEGGSRLGYKIVGLITIFIGFLIMTGMISGFLEWILGPLLRVSR